MIESGPRAHDKVLHPRRDATRPVDCIIAINTQVERDIYNLEYGIPYPRDKYPSDIPSSSKDEGQEDQALVPIEPQNKAVMPRIETRATLFQLPHGELQTSA